jgi:uncharacterized Zn finger protein (UPF0148 family)
MTQTDDLCPGCGTARLTHGRALCQACGVVRRITIRETEAEAGR